MTSRHSLSFYYSVYYLFALLLLGANTQGQENVLSYFNQITLPDEHVIHADAEDTIRGLLDTLLNRLKCVQVGLTFFECFRCLTPSSVLKTLVVKATSHTLNVLHIRRLSVIFLYHVFSFETTCREKLDASLAVEYVHYRNSTRVLLVEGENNQLSYSRTQNVMRRVKMVYQPLHLQKCVTIEKIWSALNQTSEELENAVELFSSIVVGHILSGRCLSCAGTYEDFTDRIFHEYGDRCTGTLNVKGIERLIKRVKGWPDDDRDQKEIAECPKDRSEYVAHTKHSVRINTEENELNTAELQDTSNTSLLNDPDENTISGRTKRSVDYPNEDTNLAAKCWKTEELIALFRTADNDSIGREEFSQLCPALLQQITAGCCKPTSAASLEKEAREEDIATAELYCYSSLAVLIISLSSLFGLLLLPILSTETCHYVMACLIGLSFSTMTCDAFLHLIPQGLGLHEHSEKLEEPSDGEEQDTSNLRLVCQQATILITIYLLFLFETITDITVNGKHHKKNIVKFLYYPPQTEDEKHPPVSVRIRCLSSISNKKEKSESHMELAKRPRSVSFITPVEGDHKVSRDVTILKTRELCGGLTSVAWAVTIADSFHNFGDGLAIGAAFHASLETGLFTSIAVLFHEVPHEFGDFAVLLSTGLSFPKAMAINFISALSCFIGLYVGLQIGDNTETRKWIMSATAGIFLYVSLTEILPELKKTKGRNPYKMLAVKNVGIIVGAVFMLVIAAYEDKIHV